MRYFITVVPKNQNVPTEYFKYQIQIDGERHIMDVVIIGIDCDFISKLLSVNTKKQEEINIIGLLSEVVITEQDLSKIELEIKILDLSDRFESNDLVLSKSEIIDKHQLIESRKPMWSERKAIRKTRTKEYFRRKR